jgi:hypothetical protein
MNKVYLGVIGLLLVIAFFFAPSQCNGVTYYNGYKGCTTGGKGQ